MSLPSIQSLLLLGSNVFSLSSLDAIARRCSAEAPSAAGSSVDGPSTPHVAPPPTPPSTLPNLAPMLREHLLHTSTTISTLVSDLVNTFPLTSPMLLPPPNSEHSACPTHTPHPSSAVLLPEVLLQIFSFLTPEEVLCAGPVCKTWHETAISPILWTSKVCPTLAATCHCPLFNPAPKPLCHEPLGDTPQPAALELAPTPADDQTHRHEPTAQETGGLAHLGPALKLTQLWLAFHHRNFLRNPSFHRLLNMDRAAWKKWRRNAWVLQTLGPDSVGWECPPLACAPVPVAPKLFPAGAGAGGVAARAQQQLQGLFGGEQQGCISTSSEWSEVMQVVDFVDELQRRGLSRDQATHVLDSGLPLGFSMMAGAHADSGGQFSFCMFLMEQEPEDVLNIAQRFVAKPSRYHFYSGKLKTTRPGQWQRFAHVVDSVPVGLRFGIILVRGRGESSQRGHFGVKLAAAQLTFLHQAERTTFAKGDEHFSWVRRMVEMGVGPNQGAIIQAAAAAAAAEAAAAAAAAPAAVPVILAQQGVL